MNDEVQLISDGDGLSVIGAPTAVERFLEAADQWVASQELDLRRLTPLLAVGSNVAQAASEMTANSGRWIKLTEESARLVKEHGLMASKTPGQGHLMIGTPGKVKNWLQGEQGLESLVANPDALSGLGGIMSQAALRQNMAEITDYLVRIDQKVDAVLRKVDDAVVAQMVGVGETIDRALMIREETGEVNTTLWSTVDQAHQTISASQAYALGQLDAIATSLERAKSRGLASTAEGAGDETPKWLAVLARCFQLQDAIDVLELDRVLADSPAALPAYRRGLERSKRDRRGRIGDRTDHLLSRIDMAVDRANATIVWSRARSLEVIESANTVGTGVHDLQRLLRIESDPQSWDARELWRGADIGSQAIQVAKDKGPAVLTIGMAAAAAAVKFNDGIKK